MSDTLTYDLADALREQAEMQAAAPVAGPCPDWCTETAGRHRDRFDDEVDDGTWTRCHDQRIGAIEIRQFETLHPDGTVTLDPPTILVPNPGDLDSVGARRLAADLLSAAAKLEKIR